MLYDLSRIISATAELVGALSFPAAIVAVALRAWPLNKPDSKQ